MSVSIGFALLQWSIWEWAARRTSANPCALVPERRRQIQRKCFGREHVPWATVAMAPLAPGISPPASDDEQFQQRTYRREQGGDKEVRREGGGDGETGERRGSQKTLVRQAPHPMSLQISPLHFGMNGSDWAMRTRANG